MARRALVLVTLASGAGAIDVGLQKVLEKTPYGKIMTVGTAGLGLIAKARHSRQEGKAVAMESLRTQTSRTAEFVVWRELNLRGEGVVDEARFDAMVAEAMPMVEVKKHKGRRPPNAVMKLFTFRPSKHLVKLYLEEDIAKALKEDGVKFQGKAAA